jgi:hypothetical protein
MATMQDVLNRSRIPLNDDEKIRYTDERALEFANTAIARAYQVRPDLRFGSYGTAFTPLAVGADFPLPYQHVQSVADYVTGRLQTIDEEATAAEKAVAYMSAFESALASA